MKEILIAALGMTVVTSVCNVSHVRIGLGLFPLQNLYPVPSRPTVVEYRHQAAAIRPIVCKVSKCRLV